MAMWTAGVRNSLRLKENSLSQRASSSCKLKSARRASGPEARRQAALAINASLNPDDTLAAIVRQACALTACRRCAVYLLDGKVGTLLLVAGHRLPNGLLGSKLSASRSLVGQAFRGQSVLVTDAADPLEASSCLGHKLAAVPLVAHRKRLGVLQVARGAKERRFSSGDIAELEWFAPLAAQALANAQDFYRSVRTISQFQISNETLHAMDQVARAVIDAGGHPDPLLIQAFERACNSLHLCGGAVRLYDERTGKLETVVERGLPETACDPLLDGAPLVEAQSGAPGGGTLVTLPLVARESAVGIMQALTAPGQSLGPDDRDVLAMVANRLALGIENARLFRLAEINEQQVRAVLSSTDNVVLYVDAETRLMAANAVAERAFGFRVQVCAGQPLSEIAQNQALHQAMDQVHYQHDARWRTFRVPLSQERILSCTMSPILTRGGILQGWVLVMKDIAQFKEMGQLRTDMILTASHELRNPINLTLGALELLDQYLEAPSTLQREALDLAKLGIERAGALIGDLLDLERIERRVGMRPGWCDCALLLSSLGSEFRLWAQNHDKALQMRVPDTPLLVWGDEHLLQRVVSNLVDNALKYTPPGGCITVDACAQVGQVILKVSDTGLGIPLEAQPHVFERFYRQSGQPDSVEGTGLGLTIVKSIVEQHGGRVWVTSQPGQGSTFTVSLPALDT